MTVLVAAGVLWILGRFLRGAKLGAAGLLLIGFLGLVGMLLAVGMTASRSAAPRMASEVAPASAPAPSMDRSGKDATGNWVAQTVVGGVIEGVTPVALNLPGYVRSVSASRELVTRDRPFSPVLIT